MIPALREQVRSRARDRCEYCRLPQSAVPATFHVEHVRALQHGGTDSLENLALSCDRCNAFKGTNLTSVDPATNNVVYLFNPRVDSWNSHFAQDNFDIIGITDVGRATVRLLNMNAIHRVDLRRVLAIDLTASD
jgi:hypothetical protein